MPSIQYLQGLEILDSRGRPTVKATCRLASGAVAQASAPSGASTGAAEALELRDGDPGRYAGLGCRKAASHVSRDLNEALSGSAFPTQAAFDEALNRLDGTANKSRLGANAVVAVSVAFARAHALEKGLPLYEHLASLLGATPRLPRPTINLFSGGKHGGGQVSIQDVLIVPVAATTIDEALATAVAVYQAAATQCADRYGMRLLTADEGGLAPPFPNVKAAFDEALRAIEGAGFRPGEDVALAVDVAASHFFEGGRYRLGKAVLNSEEMVDVVASWAQRYPIISVEDGLAEEDWAGWPRLREQLGPDVLTLGDDLLCTNPKRIERAIEAHAASALLLKVNQVGTLTEAAAAYNLARAAGWPVVVSARSGETEDDWLADLAVGWGADYIKVGSVTQSERLAKYNRLLEIEAATDLQMA